MKKDTQYMLLETVCMLLEEKIKKDTEFDVHWVSTLSKLQFELMSIYITEE